MAQNEEFSKPSKSGVNQFQGAIAANTANPKPAESYAASKNNSTKSGKSGKESSDDIGVKAGATDAQDSIGIQAGGDASLGKNGEKDAGGKNETGKEDKGKEKGDKEASGKNEKGKGDNGKANGTQSTQEYSKSGVEAHNIFRKVHNAPEMKNNEKMAQEAEAYAKELAASFKFQHSKTKDGENLGMSCSRKKGSELSAAVVTKMW